MEMISPPPARKRIVLVEDDVAIRRALQMLLTSEGYEVRSYAKVGGIARDPEVLSAHFLIADLILPDNNAFCLIEDLKAAGWSGAGILVSGYLTPERISLASRAGFSRVIAKPFREAELSRALTELGRG